MNQKEFVRQTWNAATVATKQHPMIGTRYELEPGRKGLVMRPINPGEPGYDLAPYEMTAIMNK